MSQDRGSFKNKVAVAWAFIKNIAAHVWRYLKVAKMEYIVMVSLFAADLISKAIVNATVSVNQAVVLIPNFLNVHNLHNYNAVFGSSSLTNMLGSVGTRIFFGVFAVAASVVFILILIKSKGGNRLFRVALAMLVAGAMGNCIDRMFLGYVRDFVEFVYFGLTIGDSTSFYVFNIADAELVIGVILVIIYFLFMYHDKESATVEDNKLKADTAATSNANINEDGSAENSENDIADGSVEAESVVKEGTDGSDKSNIADGVETPKDEIADDDATVMPENNADGEEPNT